MNNIAVRPVGYTGSVEEILWTAGLGNNTRVTAYLWGGGGGGGGNDSGTGGAGAGGNFSSVNFTINEGDEIQIAVGGQGAGGSSGNGASGGPAGASYKWNLLNSRTATPLYGVTVTPITYSTWRPWFNQWAVQTSSADIYYSVNFPTTGYYNFSIGADYGMTVYIDGNPVASCTGYAGSYEDPSPASTTAVYVTAGLHLIRVVWDNDGGTNGWALVITGGGQSCFSGGRGGNSGYVGRSGAGGGGGGATVLLLNNAVIGVAGGGGGGGGAGNKATRNGDSAPGNSGQDANDSAGQNGQDKPGDGGGGGGGGGGYGGGNGGLERFGDQGALAGSSGSNYTVNGVSLFSTGILPAGAGYPYYDAFRGRGGSAGGGSGTTGSAMLEFELGGIYVYNNGAFSRATTYVKTGNVWKQTSAQYIKQNGIWRPLIGTFAPTYNFYSNQFGVDSRPGYVPPPPPPPVIGMNDIF